MSKEIVIGKIDMSKIKKEDSAKGPNKIMMPGGSGWVEISEDEYYESFSIYREIERLEKLANCVRRPKKKRSISKKKEDKLVVTNYDNFANASFFIDQYYKAKDMLEEVDKFFKSFIMSRLISIEDLNKHKINAIDKGEWLDAFAKSDSFCQKISSQQDAKKYTYEKRSDGSTDYDKTHYFINKDTLKKIVDESVELLQQSKNMNNPKYRTLFVIDENGVLHDFIPECLKDEIAIDFNDKAIILTGKYYHYSEWGAQWGKSESSMEEVTVRVIIDPANNNVKGVLREEKEIQSGNANGKSYWASHERYCQPRLSGPYSYQTPDNSTSSRL